MSDTTDDPACQFQDDDIDWNAVPVTSEKKTQSLATFSPSAEVPLITISTLPAERIVYHKSEVPQKFQRVFDEYPYFNVLQSKILPDLLQHDNSVAVCAPTGSGKTGLFELAIIRVLMQHDHFKPEEKFIDKIIYLSPLKSICAEKRQEWTVKFEPLGVRVCELTGDSDRDEHAAAYQSNIIITTPEKWDAMTRKWRDANRTIMMQTRLICIDEVHLLSEQNRGATLETIVSRVKTAKRLAAGTPPKQGQAPIRFVAVSATAPNITDVAQWLSVSGFPGKAYKMENTDRPVQLTQIVKGIHCNNPNPYAFDNMLRQPIAEVIRSYGNGKPALIFCMTRLSTVKSAKELYDDLPSESNPNITMRRKVFMDSIKNEELRSLMLKGVAYHNAGVSQSDRQVIEDAFRQELVQALFSTSTLAMGVNLPAYMVVLKGVHKVAGRAMTEELTETELLQMTGRAGRPQFGDHGVAVILCADKDQLKYQRLINGEKILESSLHKSLPEHMNSEIVLQTIDNKDMAVDWLKSTFFYIRCIRNKKYYDISPNSGQAQVDRHLSTLCNKELNGLQKYQMIQISEDGSSISATEIGRLMAHYCVSFETMKSFVTAKPGSSLQEMLMLICACKEVKQEIVLRTDEKKTLFSYSDPKDSTAPNIRFPLTHKVKEVAHKIYTIWQIEFGSLEKSDEMSKFRMDITKTLKAGKRMAKCLVEILILPEKHSEVGARTVRNAVLVSQIINSGLWENSPQIARQLRGIGAKYSADLIRAGIRSFDQLRSQSAERLDQICGRKNGFGEDLLRRVRGLPMYRITGRQVLAAPNLSRADFTISLMNADKMRDVFNTKQNDAGPTAGRMHTVHMCISDSNDKVIAHWKFRDEKLYSGPVTESVVLTQSEREPKTSYTITLYSDSWVGIDLPIRKFSIKFPYFESIVDEDLFPHNVIAASSIDPVAEPVIEQQQQQPAAPKVPKPRPNVSVVNEMGDMLAPECHHKCRDKTLCMHECCKTSGRAKRAMKETHPVQKSAQIAKRYQSKTTSQIIRNGISVGDRVTGPTDSFFGPAPAATMAPISAAKFPEPQLPLFPKPFGYHAEDKSGPGSAVCGTAASVDQSPQSRFSSPLRPSNRTLPKRRPVFEEEEDDDADDLDQAADGMEIVTRRPAPAGGQIQNPNALSSYTLPPPLRKRDWTGYSPALPMSQYQGPAVQPDPVAILRPDAYQTPVTSNVPAPVRSNFQAAGNSAGGDAAAQCDEGDDFESVRQRLIREVDAYLVQYQRSPVKKYRPPGWPPQNQPQQQQQLPYPQPPTRGFRFRSLPPLPPPSIPIPRPAVTPLPATGSIQQTPRDRGVDFVTNLQPVPEFEVKIPPPTPADYLKELKALTELL